MVEPGQRWTQKPIGTFPSIAKIAGQIYKTYDYRQNRGGGARSTRLAQD